MIKNYITKIKGNITIYATKKSSNILDGTYKSIYKGRSMNFEDLREYVVGDNIKDIDWKASARSGKILIRQFIAEKKHNIMFVLDTGKKMLADTNSLESKKEIAIISAGILAYLADKNGDYVGAIYNKNNSITLFPFKSGIYNIEKILYNYEADVEKNEKLDLENLLEYISRYIKRRMIICVITDIDGMQNIKESTMKKISVLNDIMFININDANLTGKNVYDIEEESYIPRMLLGDEKLHQLEKKIKEQMYIDCVNKLKKYKASVVSIDNTQEITKKIIDLLERHKHANIS